MKVLHLRPEYVDFIPREPSEGVLYISKRFGTASHLCCCGCGTKVVTPLRPTEYSLTEVAAGSVSLSPSIGNWNHPCQAHYWIRDNRVIEARPMTQAEIQFGRRYDDALKEEYFARAANPWWRRVGTWIARMLRSPVE